jgi:hypothetical protein
VPAQVFELRLILSAAGVGGAARTAAGAFKTVERSIHNAMQQMITFNTVGRIGKRMLTGAGSIAEGLLDVAEKSASAEISLRRTTTVLNRQAKSMGKSTVDWRNLRHELDKTASNLMLTSEEMVKIAETATFGGIATSLLDEGTQDMNVSLGRATQVIGELNTLMGSTNVEATTGALISMLQLEGVTGDTEEKMRKLGGALRTLRTSTRASSDEIYKLVPRVAKAAEVSGVTAEAVFSMAHTFLQASQTPTLGKGAMNKLIQQLTTYPDRVADALQLENLEAYLNAGATDAALALVIDRLGMLAQEEGGTIKLSQALRDMGLDATRVGLNMKLLAADFQGLKLRTKEYHGVLNDANLLSELYRDSTAGTGASLKILSDNITILKRKMGDFVLDTFADTIQSMKEWSQDLIDNAKNIMPAFIQGLRAIMIALVVVGLTLIAVSTAGVFVKFLEMTTLMVYQIVTALKLVPAASQAAMTSATSAFARIRIAMAASLGPIFWIMLAISALVGLFYVLGKAAKDNFGGLGDALAGVWATVKDTVDVVWGAMKKLGKAIFAGFTAPFGGAQGALSALVRVAKFGIKLFNGLMRTLATVAEVLSTILAPALYAIGAVIGGVWAFTLLFIGALDWLIDTLGQIPWVAEIVIGLLSAMALILLVNIARTVAYYVAMLVLNAVMYAGAAIQGMYNAILLVAKTIKAVYTAITWAATAAAGAFSAATLPIVGVVLLIAAAVVLLILTIRELWSLLTFGAVGGTEATAGFTNMLEGVKGATGGGGAVATPADRRRQEESDARSAKAGYEGAAPKFVAEQRAGAQSVDLSQGSVNDLSSAVAGTRDDKARQQEQIGFDVGGIGEMIIDNSFVIDGSVFLRVEQEVKKGQGAETGTGGAVRPSGVGGG